MDDRRGARHRVGLSFAAELVDGGADQELDGARARQLRYADELRHGRWDLPSA